MYILLHSATTATVILSTYCITVHTILCNYSMYCKVFSSYHLSCNDMDHIFGNFTQSWWNYYCNI